MYPLKYTIKCSLIVDNNNNQQLFSFWSMLIFTLMFAPHGALSSNMDVSCTTSQQIVYQPVDVALSLSKSGIKSLSRLRYLAYVLWWIIQHWEEQHVYIHIRVAHHLFRNCELPHCCNLVQLAFQADMVPVPEDVYLCLCTSHLPADLLLGDFGNKGSCLFEFPIPLLCVFLLLPSQFHVWKNQLPTSSLPGLLREVS